MKTFFLSFFNIFLQLSLKLHQKIDNQENQSHNDHINVSKDWFSGFFTLEFFVLLQKNSSVKNEMKQVERLCEKSLQLLKNKILIKI